MGKSKLGLLSCVGVIVSGCIGSAIFSLSGLTMWYAGAACVVSWILAAAIQGLYGAQAAEMSLHYGKSSGVYVFPAKALGKAYGFFASWGYVVSSIMAISFSAIYIGTYLSVSFSLFGNSRVALAVISIALCAALNMMNVRSMGKLNNILAVSLALLMLAFCAIAFFHPNFSLSNFTPFFGGSKGKFGFLAAVPNALVAYGSVVSVAFMAENVENPKRNIPLSLAIALAVVVTLYVLMIVSAFGHVGYDFLESNPAMRFIPMFAAAFYSMSDVSYLPILISLAAVFALLTSMLIMGYLAAVAMQGMAKDGTLPGLFARETSDGAPVFSILVCACLSIVLSIRPAFAEMLVNLGSLISAITMVLVIASFIALRRNERIASASPDVQQSDDDPSGAGHAASSDIRPDSASPIMSASSAGRVMSSEILAYLAIAAIVACCLPGVFAGGWRTWIFSALVYAAGLAVYFLCARRGNG